MTTDVPDIPPGRHRPPADRNGAAQEGAVPTSDHHRPKSSETKAASRAGVAPLPSFVAPAEGSPAPSDALFGESIRQLRNRSNLKQEAVATAMGWSTAVQSRVENGTRDCTPEEVRHLARVVQASPWETAHLCNLVGYLPDPPPSVGEEQFEAFAVLIMSQLPYPAFMADAYMFIRAWNGATHAIWNPPTEGPVHMLDDLFSSRVRSQLAHRWRDYVTRAVWLFYNRSLPVANTPRYRALLTWLHQRHGDEFLQIWDEAWRMGYGSTSAQRPGGVLVQYPTPGGEIQYVVFQSMLMFPSSMELYMYIPYGRENVERHRQFEEAVDFGTVYTADPPPFAIGDAG